MADAWRQQIQTDEAAARSVDERLGLLVDADPEARREDQSGFGHVDPRQGWSRSTSPPSIEPAGSAAVRPRSLQQPQRRNDQARDRKHAGRSGQRRPIRGLAALRNCDGRQTR